jgi:hypothetical protein
MYMAHNTDWLPTKREEQLAMARDWQNVIGEIGSSWGIPPAAMQNLDTLINSPDDLHKSFSTKRRRDLLEFESGDSGTMAYFAVQVENEGKKGPWGPLVNALIP